MKKKEKKKNKIFKYIQYVYTPGNNPAPGNNDGSQNNDLPPHEFW